MVKQKLILAFTLFLGLFGDAFAQNPKDIGLDVQQYFAYFSDTTFVTENEVDIGQRFDRRELMADYGEVINVLNIKYLHSPEGYFAVLERQLSRNQNQFLLIKRIEEGHLSIYQHGTQYRDGPSPDFYYSIGMGDLKVPSYENYKADLVIAGTGGIVASNNREIQRLLDKGYQRNKTRNVLLLTALGTLTSAFVVYADGKNSNSRIEQRNKQLAGYGLFAASIGIGLTSRLFDERKYHAKAIKVFNKNY